jgi:hypothetical protein
MTGKPGTTIENTTISELRPAQARRDGLVTTWNLEPGFRHCATARLCSRRDPLKSIRQDRFDLTAMRSSRGSLPLDYSGISYPIDFPHENIFQRKQYRLQARQKNALLILLGNFGVSDEPPIAVYRQRSAFRWRFHR